MGYQTKLMPMIRDAMTISPQDAHDLLQHASTPQGCSVHGVTA